MEGSGYVYQYAGRVSALCPLLVVVLRASVLSGAVRNRVVVTLAGTLVQAFKMLGRGANARPRMPYASSRHARPLNAALDSVAFATAIGVIANETVGKVQSLRARIAGAPPDWAEIYACFPSDAHPFARGDGWF